MARRQKLVIRQCVKKTITTIHFRTLQQDRRNLNFLPLFFFIFIIVHIRQSAVYRIVVDIKYDQAPDQLFLFKRNNDSSLYINDSSSAI